MDRNETLKWLIHKRMEVKAKLEFFKLVDPANFGKELDKLLDRLNEIDAIIKEIEKNK